jgi:transcriptional regulator with XRE-family HTH domain
MNYMERIKETREDLDISQKQIAEYLNITQPQYSKYERGINQLPINYLYRICLFLNTSADYILGLPKNLRYIER